MHWSQDAIFYHIYPLGACGAPASNDFSSPPVPRLARIRQWIPHLRRLGINAVYLGPVFESTAHGYDTANFYQVDRRLGDHATLAGLSVELHRNGIRLILDGVFNHVGRDFWAFQDVQLHRTASAYIDWFDGLRFDTRSPYGDPFTYKPWNGHYDLVRMNQQNPDVRGHLFEAVRMWVNEFGIDGLRLDVADCLDLEFMRLLREFTTALRPDFWLMGEVVHGDYRRWVNPRTLHSVTNYECYKGLSSSLADRNYFEIAYALNRQFAPTGMYSDLALYNFVDNHDVNRVASTLENPAHLYPLYLLLFTMPGIPSIYYGSEWGLEGKRTSESDAALRPALDLDALQASSSHPNLVEDISKLASVRKALPALRQGSYAQLFVSHQQFAFARETENEYVVVALNASDSPVSLEINLPRQYRHAIDILNGEETFQIEQNTLRIKTIYPYWGRVFKLA
jgi:glycosidase